MAEATAQYVADPAQILHDQRVAQAKLRHVAGALFRCQLGEPLGAEYGDQGIAGQNAQHEEHDDRDAEDRECAERKATNDIAVHNSAFLWRTSRRFASVPACGPETAKVKRGRSGSPAWAGPCSPAASCP